MRIMCFSIFCIFISCTSKVKQTQEPIKNNQASAIRTLEEFKKTKVSNYTSNSYLKEINRIDIDSFLKKPFDVHKFKKKKNGSNSGSTKINEYHYQPTKYGINYGFFLFGPKSPYDTIDGKIIRSPITGYKYHGNKKFKTISEQGILIKTFQPTGKYMHKYNNPRETLIEVVARYNDYDLPELAFIGRSRQYRIAKFGEPHYTINNCDIYSSKNKVLLFNRKERWLKYAVLKNNYAPNKSYNGLYKE